MIFDKTKAGSFPPFKAAPFLMERISWSPDIKGIQTSTKTTSGRPRTLGVSDEVLQLLTDKRAIRQTGKFVILG
jgi:hypothetical protein